MMLESYFWLFLLIMFMVDDTLISLHKPSFVFDRVFAPSFFLGAKLVSGCPRLLLDYFYKEILSHKNQNCWSLILIANGSQETAVGHRFRILRVNCSMVIV